MYFATLLESLACPAGYRFHMFYTANTLAILTYVPFSVLQQYCKLNEQMNRRQYYSALKTLEQLEHTLLPPVKGYIFSDLLKKEIPKIRKSIEDESNAELTVSFGNSLTSSYSLCVIIDLGLFGRNP